MLPALADQLINSKASDAEKLTTAFRKIVCRQPLKKETDILTQALISNRTHFKAHPSEAEKIIDVGEYEVTKNTSPAELAAMMVVVQTIFNLDEAISKT